MHKAEVVDRVKKGDGLFSRKQIVPFCYYGERNLEGLIRKALALLAG